MKGVTLPLEFRASRGERARAHTPHDKLTGDFRVCPPLFLLEERAGGTGVRQRDKEGAGSTETTGLEKPEAGPAARKRHVTGDRDSRRGGRACLRGAVPPRCGGPWARCVCPPFCFLLPLQILSGP